MALRSHTSRKRRRESENDIYIPPFRANSLFSERDLMFNDLFDYGPTFENQRPTEEPPSRAKFIVGLDYGTTYSSVSYIKYDPDDPPKTAFRDRIKSVLDWPSPGEPARCPEVPSESWYLGGEYFWGYNAREKLKGVTNLQSKNQVIQFAKLLLSDEKGQESGPRKQLKNTLKEARKKETEVIQDYLRELLRHSKTYLVEYEEFHDGSEVEVALCVPAGWSGKALRTIQAILLEVMEEIRFGNPSAPFILNEPEAAAAYVLEANPEHARLKQGSLFMVCDAGGGTVDAITYQVRQDQPFRVDEVVTPAGRNCGSSYINKALKREVLQRLEGEEYLIENGTSYEYIVEHEVMAIFERQIKRKFDASVDKKGRESVAIRGLRSNDEKHFADSILYIPRKQIAKYFNHSLKGTRRLIQEQLDAASEKGLVVDKILLVGGFSRSPTLRNHIANTFRSQRLIPVKADMSTAVSHGAVFRALNKEAGPSRQVQSNFAFLQDEEYNKNYNGHNAGSPVENLYNGRVYIEDVLDWVIKRDRLLPMKAPFIRRNYRIFKSDEELEVSQRIYISDAKLVHNHYEVNHPKNRVADSYGLLVVSLQRLKDEGLITPKMGNDGEHYYEIHYELLLRVDGRNMTLQLIYPPGGESQGQIQVCIAAAFIPGTE